MTADIYVKKISEDVVAAMQKLEANVVAEMKKAAKPELNVVQKPN